MVKQKLGRARLPMGQLEARVMDVLWDDGGWLAPGEVQTALATNPPLAYTTVMTILVRLYEKGLVDREKRSRAWTYHPIETREQATATRMQALLARPGDRKLALASFVQGMSASERATLRRALEKRSRS